MVVWPFGRNLELARATAVEIPTLGFVDAIDDPLDDKLF